MLERRESYLFTQRRGTELKDERFHKVCVPVPRREQSAVVERKQLSYWLKLGRAGLAGDVRKLRDWFFCEKRLRDDNYRGFWGARALP